MSGLSSNIKEYPSSVQYVDSHIGEIRFISHTNIPSGWMECNGVELSRALFSELFAAIGTTFGVGDGSTTFNIPDMRGVFPRGWDHGRGVDIERTLGSDQLDAFQGHKHITSGASGISGASNFNPIFGGETSITTGLGGYTGLTSLYAVHSGDSNIPDSSGTNGTPRFSHETRPRNVAFVFIIKVKNIVYDPYVYRGNALTLGGIPASGFLLASQGVNRNAIINGNGMVQQRASVTLSASAQYGVDRWAAYASGTAVSAGIFGQSTSGPIGRTGYGIALTNATITGTGTVYFRYRIEAKDALKFMNQPAVFSCLVYHDVGSAINYTVTVNKPSATADVFSPVTAIGSFVTSVASGTSTPLSFAISNMGTCGNGIEILISAACGGITTKNFYLTEAQFELGTVATAFEYRPFEQELAMCQRYFEKSYNTTDAPGTITNNGMHTDENDDAAASGKRITIYFKVKKRNNPTVTLYNPSTGASESWVNGAPVIISLGEQNVSIYILIAGSATINGHWTADAEL